MARPELDAVTVIGAGVVGAAVAYALARHVGIDLASGW
jgi:glycine/D-amino acid oxidase-like deaminating enzyme